MKALTKQINSYFAMLAITLVGAGAALFILHAVENAEAFIAKTHVGQAQIFLVDK
jgi:hypothetical protein